MKIEYRNEDYRNENIYKVGNVIKAYDNTLFLVVEIINGGGYALVNLTDNTVSKAYETLGILGETFSNEDDTLVEAEINVL
ncbi:hypothetical protein G5T04_08490 [Lactobacillus salivarius]|uniref:hypothetical protein n=1 Tax=Ligilactobacillus salivarius TaxID=1624 RepID=UPI0013CD7622|nr:hypothetical protein [Ligilactobacillus salivarius]NGG72704.1 hypothetical protein [Ligilactobacillus salivarius]